MTRLTESQQNRLALAVAGLCLGSVLGLFIFGPFHIGILDYQLVVAEYPDGTSLYGVTSETALVTAHETKLIDEGYAVTATHAWGTETNRSTETLDGQLSPDRTRFYSSVETQTTNQTLFIDESLTYTRASGVLLNETTDGYDAENQTLYATYLTGEQSTASDVQARSGIGSQYLYTVLQAGDFEPRSVSRVDGTVIFQYDLVRLDTAPLNTEFTRVTAREGGLTVDEFGVIREATLSVTGETQNGTSTELLQYRLSEPGEIDHPAWIETAVTSAPPISGEAVDLLVTSQPSNTLAVYNRGSVTLPAGTVFNVTGPDGPLSGTLASPLSPSEAAYFIPSPLIGLVTTDDPAGATEMISVNLSESNASVTYKSVRLATVTVQNAATLQTGVGYQWIASPYSRSLEVLVLGGDTLPAGALIQITGDNGVRLAGRLDSPAGQGDYIYLRPDYLFRTLEVSVNDPLAPRSQAGGVTFPPDATLMVSAFGETYVDESIRHTGEVGLADPLSAELQISEQRAKMGLIYSLSVESTTADTVRVHYAVSAESPTVTASVDAGETLAIQGASTETTAIVELVRDDTRYIVSGFEPFGSLTEGGGYTVTVSPEGVTPSDR